MTNPTLTINGMSYIVLEAEVARIFRQTVKVGEGFRTIEQTTALTVAIPTEADPLVAAMAIGKAIDAAHEQALTPEIERVQAQARAAADNTPATSKQLNYVRSLLKELDGPAQQAAYELAGLTSQATLTTGTASLLIDTLRTRAQEIQVLAAASRQAHLEATALAVGGDTEDLPF